MEINDLFLDELSKKAAENGGSVGIAAIANILKNDEDQ